MLAEEIRLEEDRKREKYWKRWGPYLSERQWATVREDYSSNGQSWDYFPFDQSAARSYRWGEDGILGITDRRCRLCFALAFWNGKDPILKERLFGLVPGQGNHGEDVKEYYFYLDSTPTHSYMKGLYKYPQERFPYETLIQENQKRGLQVPEFELIDTKIFDAGRYFDIFAEYAKNDPEDILIKITIANRSSVPAFLNFLPTLWYRNTWAWGCKTEYCLTKQQMWLKQPGVVTGIHESLGKFHFYYDSRATPLFTDNETNFEKLFGAPNRSKYVKDAFHQYIIHGEKGSINPKEIGSKFSPLYSLNLQGGESQEFHFRLMLNNEIQNPFASQFSQVFEQRKQEADAFYDAKLDSTFTCQEKEIARQAFAGLLWTKQFYYFVIEEWFKGDPRQPTPPSERLNGRNKNWSHFYSIDVISVPDKWEYPWFAAWDLAFHLIPFAKIDPNFAKGQIILFLREWMMHPSGQQPAYEYEFSDVNPPVHAWAAWRVYKISAARGERDFHFLESAFHKLLINFTWWVNKKDRKANNLFSGGFLGLDNIGVFDRSRIQKKTTAYLEQADGTAWMAFYCVTMLTIALELASQNPVYEDMASKFFEHFVHISDAINSLGGHGLWDEQDGFYYDMLKHNGQETILRTRSLVGLIPLLAVEILDDEYLRKLPGFTKRMQWFLRNRQDLGSFIHYCTECPARGHRILAIPKKERLLRLLQYLFDENEFLSPYGIRSLSKYHEQHPFFLTIEGKENRADYVPGVANSYLFGGNSNWRGPIWLPLNFLIIEALERYDYFYGETLKVEYPTRSGNLYTLKQAADDITERVIRMFLPDPSGQRPCLGALNSFSSDPHWQNLILFHEYFHAETGEGLGASHQTGWTALVARLLQKNVNSKKRQKSKYLF